MSTISQKEEENLQTLFCPALDAELVLSVLHDLQDYDKAVELLVTLCAESPPDISDPISASAFAHEIDTKEELHRVGLLFDDGTSDLLIPESDSWVDRDLSAKLSDFNMNGRPSRSNSDGRENRIDKGKGGATWSRSLKECRTIFESKEVSFPPLPHVETITSNSNPRNVTDIEAADALEFANACFPSKSEEEIATLLHDCDYNLDLLAASLLTDTTAGQGLMSEDETNIPGNDSKEYAKNTHGRSESFDDQFSRNHFSDAGSTTSGSVISTNHSMSTSTTDSTAFGSSSDSGSEGKDDDWRVDLLAHMLPHTPRSEILIVLDECAGDISHAACKLMPPDLEDEPEENTTENEERRNKSAPSGSATLRPTGYLSGDFDASLVHLASVFPDLSIDGLRRHLELTNGNREQAVDMVLAMNFSGQGILNGPEDQQAVGKKRRKRTVRGPAVRSQIITVAGATSVPCSPTTGITGSIRENHTVSPTDEDDPAECREYASKLYEERNKLLSRAASAHRSGNATGLGKGRALAAYYSEEGHRRGALAKKWDERAAMATIRQELNSSSDSFTVDLHGLRVSEAVPLSQQLVEKWWKSVSSEGKTKKSAARSYPYTIICGKGIHSQGGIPRLFPAISKSLIENGWEVSLETRGCVIVSGKRTRSTVG